MGHHLLHLPSFGRNNNNHHHHRMEEATTMEHQQQQSPPPPQAAPPPKKGCMAIRVGQQGEEPQRFVVPVAYLNHPLFRGLLKEAEEEYGFHQRGAITIPCHVDYFRHVRHLIDHDPNYSSVIHHHHGHHRHNSSSSSASSHGGGGGGGHFHLPSCFGGAAAGLKASS